MNLQVRNFTKNIPIFNLNQIERNSVILVASSGKILTSLSKLRKKGFEHVLHYVDFLRYGTAKLTDLPFNENFPQEYDKNHERFEEVYGMLKDERSKIIYKKLINFRYFYDLSFLEGFKSCEYKQYFEDFLSLNKEIFVDGGGFDGLTTKLFIEKCPSYKKVYFFEPDKGNLEKAMLLLKNYKNINFYGVGLYSKKMKLKFKKEGSSSHVSEEGGEIIDVDKFDSIINDKVTYIKLDIEGSEEEALDGMHYTIKKYYPKLAVSVYHSPNSFWRIPQIVLNTRDDYNIYLRHYTESIYETIMYFIPKK